MHESHYVFQMDGKTTDIDPEIINWQVQFEKHTSLYSFVDKSSVINQQSIYSDFQIIPLLILDSLVIMRSCINK